MNEWLNEDVSNLRSMLSDAKRYGCEIEDADYMRGLLEAIISATIIERNGNG